MSKIAVVARSDGRAGVSLWGTRGKRYAGEKVFIGGRELTVTTDGRLNIPKAIMDQMGYYNSDGRRVAVIQITSTKEAGNQILGARVYNPPPSFDTMTTGDIVPTTAYRGVALETGILQPNDYMAWGDSA